MNDAGPKSIPRLAPNLHTIYNRRSARLLFGKNIASRYPVDAV
jgi:hypothetical protein